MSQSNSVGLIDLQIMWNRLIAVVEEQAQTLMRTAFSPIVRECGDLSAGGTTRIAMKTRNSVTANQPSFSSTSARGYRNTISMSKRMKSIAVR